LGRDYFSLRGNQTDKGLVERHRCFKTWRLECPSLTASSYSARRAKEKMQPHPPSIVTTTWLARFRKVLAETGNEDEAKYQADRSVRRAHGSSAQTDLYNLQILVDHFKGKRSAADPEVQRQFQLLRQQAENDWKELYAGKNTKATPENMAEDYIHNAKLTAETQGKLTKIKWIALFIVLAVVALVNYALNK
jgi:hypothetical protein